MTLSQAEHLARVLPSISWREHLTRMGLEELESLVGELFSLPEQPWPEFFSEMSGLRAFELVQEFQGRSPSPWGLEFVKVPSDAIPSYPSSGFVSLQMDRLLHLAWELAGRSLGVVVPWQEMLFMASSLDRDPREALMLMARLASYRVVALRRRPEG